MTERVKATEPSPDATALVASLLHHYGFDLGDDAIAPLLLSWQEQYPAAWIRLATIEALYQGRYKAISVAQILTLWQRRSQPTYHFNHEFERLICNRLPQTLASPALSTPTEPLATRSAAAIVANLPYQHMALSIAGLEATPLHDNTDVMRALRTLHTAMADAPLADSAESSAEPTDRSCAQIGSYTLRSEESPSQLLTHEQSALLAQSKVDPTLRLLDAEPSGNIASAAAVSDERLQAGSIATTNPRLDVEPIPLPGPPAPPASPVSFEAQVQSTPQATSIARILRQLDHQEMSAKTIFPGVGLLAQTLQPRLHLHLTAHYQPIWFADPSGKQPIHQFTPAPEASDFHQKLKLVAQVPEDLPEGDL